MSFVTEFDTPPIFEQEMSAAFNPAENDFESFEDGPADTGLAESTSEKAPGERAHALLASKDRFKESAAQRTAALVYASLEQAAATDRQTAAIDRQNEILERQAEIAQRAADIAARTFTEARIQNQLRFYSLDESDFLPKRSAVVAGVDGKPGADSVWTQFKRNLGIIAAKPAVREVEAGTPGVDLLKREPATPGSSDHEDGDFT